MATFKHISSKNADYGAAEAYLTFEHDEFTMKPTLDENGRLIPREDYRISSLNCGGEDFAVACMNNKMITIPYADAIEYGENTSALFKALWELTDLIRLESNLKKHHRAYLHVREDIDEKVKEARQIMTKVSVDMIGFYFKVDVPESSNSDENPPFADAADDEAVSIPKDKYELMIDDLLTMSEIIQCVADMRTQDAKAIREFGKFVPAFAAFEKNRLSLYREAAKEAEEIFNRWADEIDDLDEDYEPDEYYSD